MSCRGAHEMQPGFESHWNNDETMNSSDQSDGRLIVFFVDGRSFDVR